MRERWANLVNEYLARANVPREEWVDHRTLEAQREEALTQGDYVRAIRLSRLPTRHRGKAATAIVARGGISTRVEDLERDEQAGAPRVAAMLWEVEQVAQVREREEAERRLGDVWLEVAVREERRRAGRIEQVEAESGGQDLLDRQLDALDEGWRDRREARVACMDRAVAFAEMEVTRIKEERRATESRERALAAAREARVRDLQDRFGGREVHNAHLAALVPAGQDPTGEQVEEALTAAESDAERLRRACELYENRWSRVYYATAARALGDRFTLEKVDAAMMASAAFARRASGLSEVGCAVLETAVEECGEHPAVGELVAALERAQEVERQEEERQRGEEQRRDQVARREADVRATQKGPQWLSEATEWFLQGSGRPATLEDRDGIAGMVEAWIREDLDLRQTELRASEEGASFLNEAWRNAAAVTTLAEEEPLLSH